MRLYQTIQTTCCVSVLLAVSLSVPAQAASPESKRSKQDGPTRGESASTMPQPKDCAQIKPGTANSTTEAATQKDCERSQHLGAGTGTSSGTGSGKMQSGSGPR